MLMLSRVVRTLSRWFWAMIFYVAVMALAVTCLYFWVFNVNFEEWEEGRKCRYH